MAIAPRGQPFPKRPFFCKLSRKAWAELEDLFSRLDLDGSNAVSRQEALDFFQGKFGQLSVDEMFSKVDCDDSGAITAPEFASYWVHIRNLGYSEQEILDEVSQILKGGTWVAWSDNRKRRPSFPTRSMCCRLSAQTWAKCEKLFNNMDTDQSCIITREKATAYFKIPFANLSADAMFNEIDQLQHGQFTAKDWFDFWEQVRSSGYSDATIQEELDLMLEGGSWVDWDDRRSTRARRRSNSSHGLVVRPVSITTSPRRMQAKPPVKAGSKGSLGTRD